MAFQAHERLTQPAVHSKGESIASIFCLNYAFNLAHNLLANLLQLFSAITHFSVDIVALQQA